MSKHGGTSRVAFALAVGVAISLVILTAGVFFAIADEQSKLSAEASTLASAVLGGAVGALATYLGGTKSDEDEYERGYNDGLDAWDASHPPSGDDDIIP
jgi:hypothetical protein